jgi:hypothetical protein
MANWADLRGYIFRTFDVEEDMGDMIRLNFRVNGGRHQYVYVRFAQNAAGVDWIQIESPVGELQRVNLGVLLSQVEDIVCGALSKVGGMVTLRHAVPMADMSVDEFEAPLRAVCASADALESSVSFQDTY